MQRQGRQGPGEESQAFVWAIKLLLMWLLGAWLCPAGAAGRAGGSVEGLHLVQWVRLQKSRTGERDVSGDGV